MFDQMQFAASVAAWCLRHGICAQRVGLTIVQNGRYACTSKFGLFGVSLEEDVPQTFFYFWSDALAFRHEASEYLFAEVYVHCPKHGVVRACGDIENGCCTACSNEHHAAI